jgi:hypothetical protein
VFGRKHNGRRHVVAIYPFHRLRPRAATLPAHRPRTPHHAESNRPSSEISAALSPQRAREPKAPTRPAECRASEPPTTASVPDAAPPAAQRASSSAASPRPPLSRHARSTHTTIGISLGAPPAGAGRAGSRNSARLGPFPEWIDPGRGGDCLRWPASKDRVPGRRALPTVSRGAAYHKKDRRRRSRRASTSSDGRTTSGVDVSSAGSLTRGGVDGSMGTGSGEGTIRPRSFARWPARRPPGSRGDEVADGRAPERRAVFAEEGGESSSEEVRDGRPRPADREGIEPGQELEVLGPLEAEVEIQLGARCSAGGHEAGPASDRHESEVGRNPLCQISDRRLTDAVIDPSGRELRSPLPDGARSGSTPPPS